MQSRRKLRFRLIVTFTLFGFCLSALFAAASLYVRAKVENQLINQSLEADVQQALENKHQHPDQPLQSKLVEGWLWNDRTVYQAPLAWQGLQPGVYDMHGGADGKPAHYKLAVARKYGLDAFLTYDISREGLGKRQLVTGLVSVVVLFTLLSLAVGYWLSRRVMRPVTELAQRLRAFRSGRQLEPLAPHFAEDEVGELAAALDDYAQRQSALIERDREFNADVSHELRTPLAVIASTTELLVATPDLPEKLHTRLQRIERAVRQATELTQALLLLSRAERSGPVDGETTDVARVVDEVIDTNRPNLGRKPIALRAEVEAAVTVEAPSSVVAVALGNLIGNACKYTQEGEIVVRVQPGRVRVEDTGPGIRAENAEHLFERGVRGEGETVKGAGLGLAIVRRLCELYGWRVTLAPRAERGAVATLDFGTAGGGEN
ncbi:MAG: HAMP domain-containing protein [Xanthomonadales bacterium]|nr:HAMP domain-containing protein [Xanthomonadales bacterium]ODU92515.1 MAG: histidine kinase [Rhodanobacter sp. SCN 66-43]OJY86508.1 MAG: sensor histidine kinase [Xanthomonadales bacterium 66-474]